MTITKEQATRILYMALDLEKTGRIVSLSEGQERSYYVARNRGIQCALTDYLQALTESYCDADRVELPLPAPYYPQWSHSNEHAAFTGDQMRAYAAAAVRAATGHCRADGRCQYAINHGAEGMAACPKGACVEAPNVGAKPPYSVGSND